MARNENREFAGSMPKNKFIVDKIRKDGCIGVMLNKSDFLDAVMWSANTIYSYKDFYSAHKDRMVIPIDDLPFWKQDLVNAHMIMINYYNVKGNTEQLESMRRSLMTVAKFQKVLAEDVSVMKHWDEYLLASNHELDVTALGRYDMGELRGKGDKYEHYSKLVAAEIEKYKEELKKSNL
jgi:hypothetical protein